VGKTELAKAIAYLYGQALRLSYGVGK